MAARTEAETITLMKAYGALELDTRTWLAGTFLTDMRAVEDQLNVADNTPEMFEQAQALDAVYAAGDSLYRAVVAACFLLHISLGRLGSSQNLADPVTNLAAWNDYLFTNSRDLESRGFTKSAWSAVSGTSVGSGALLELTTDYAGDPIDVGHVGTLQVICKKDARTLGVTAGNETFEIYGTARGDHAWEEGGPGSDGGGYAYAAYGRGVNEFGIGVPNINTGQTIQVVSGSNTAANLIQNGDFEQALIGSDSAKVPGFTITSGTVGHFTLTSTSGDKIKGTYSLDNATGGDVLTSYLTSITMLPKCPYALSVLYRVPDDGAAGTITGNMTFVLKDDTNTYQTLTVAVGSATLDAVTRASKMFISPANVTTNLRLEVTFPAYGGTSTDKRVYIDELVLTPMKILDGRAIALVAGVTDFVYDDYFTAATTDAATGKMMGFVNRVFGRHVKNDAAAATWTDW